MESVMHIQICLCGVLTLALRFARATSSDQLSAIEPLVPSAIEYSFGKVMSHTLLLCTLCNCVLSTDYVFNYFFIYPSKWQCIQLIPTHLLLILRTLAQSLLDTIYINTTFNFSNIYMHFFMFEKGSGFWIILDK